MTIHSLEQPATPKEIQGMLKTFGDYTKLAVDIKKGTLAGGGEFHADGVATLLERGSQQEDIWGADWFPKGKRIHYGALINVRSKQKNNSLEIQDEEIRRKIERVVRKLLGTR